MIKELEEQRAASITSYDCISFLAEIVEGTAHILLNMMKEYRLFFKLRGYAIIDRRPHKSTLTFRSTKMAPKHKVVYIYNSVFIFANKK